MKRAAVFLILSAFALPALAQSRVGVTSATTGGPTGKPPAQAERVLHVGVDVQANEIVSTGLNDRAHLLFLDGSSLTVGPQARLTIDKFVYDPNSKVGELAITASQGLFRFVGGKISKTTPVTVTTPSATLTIRGSIMIASVDSNRTIAIFAHGIEMTMSAHGHVTIVNRPGWQATAYFGKLPGQPTPTPPGSLGPELRQLEAIGGQPSDADNAAKTSGFSDQNSGLGPGGGGGNNTTVGNDATNAISNANNSLQRPTLPPAPMPPPPPPPPRGPFN